MGTKGKKARAVWHAALFLATLAGAVQLVSCWEGRREPRVEVRAKGTGERLRVGMDHDYRPYTYLDRGGEPSGQEVEMAEMDGYEATRRIRAAGLKTPIVAMTANAFEEDRKAAPRAGMDEHVAKPIKVARVVEVLERFLGAAGGRE